MDEPSCSHSSVAANAGLSGERRRSPSANMVDVESSRQALTFYSVGLVQGSVR